MLCHLVRVADLRSFGGAVSFSRFSCVGLARFVGSGVAVLCCRGVFSLVCAFLQCFSIFSPLYSCVGQLLFGRISLCL